MLGDVSAFRAFVSQAKNIGIFSTGLLKKGENLIWLMICIKVKENTNFRLKVKVKKSDVNWLLNYF